MVIKNHAQDHLVALRYCIDYFGGKSRMAKAIGVKPKVVYRWCEVGRISPDGAYRIHESSNGNIKREFIRPEFKQWDFE